ncbi:hypothetical protein FACS189418_5100 [Clostridia bacterium]|nr:hypothetical protein FACS189418_5100 [Clostridia bacterium]
MKRCLDPYRYEHTIGVAYISVALAMKYGVDLERAEIAGLLHDCAKAYDIQTIIQKCEKYNIIVSEEEKQIPQTLHAKLGAFIAMHKFKVTDGEIIRAILNHTTGKPGMSILEQIVYVADAIEPGRETTVKLTQIRKNAFEDLDLATYQVLGYTLEYLKKSGKIIEAMTEKAYDYYKEKINQSRVN